MRWLPELDEDAARFWGRAEVIETHISVVFLFEEVVYKLKKPVDLGFLDYSSLAARKRYCELEVALNRPNAPGVYRGIRSVDATGRLDGPGPVVDWVVEMERLHDGDTLKARIESLEPSDLERVGERIAVLHQAAERGGEEHASLETVRFNALENFDQTEDHIGIHVHADVHRRLRTLTEEALEAHGPRIDARVPLARAIHGDLRAEHVYLPADGRILLVDCVEFSERLRFGDPVADIAFLTMDLAVRGRRDLADALANTYFSTTGDVGGRALLPFYSAYRSLVRAKVRGFQDDARRARRHWLFALGELAPVGEEPRLVGVGGLPGTGKSTLARKLAAERGFTVIRSDVVRKELAGLAPTDSAAADWGTGLYSEEAKDAVYAACLERAREVLFAGGRVVIDASFSKERWRLPLLDLGHELAVPAGFLWCEVPPEIVRERLAARSGDASDADWSIYQAAREAWESPSARVLGSEAFGDD